MEFEYDNNKNLTKETEFSFNYVTAEFNVIAITTYTYNVNNRAKEEIYQTYDINTNNVDTQRKTIYTYNSNNDIIQFLDQKWNGTAYINSSKTDITYTNNKISSGFSYEWNGSNWVFGEDDSSRITINYNSQNKVSSFLSDAWNGTNWVSDSRTLISYDANQRVILQDSQIWDGANWKTDYKVEKTFDANGNAITEKDTYRDENGNLVVGSDETITFDTSVLISTIAHPFRDKSGLEYLFSTSGIVNKILSRSSSSYRTTYNYGAATASINDFSLVDFSVFPNPTTSTIKIDDSNFSIKNVYLYSIIGKKVMTSTKNELNLQNLVNGVYLLKIETENGKFATKRIVKN